MRPASFETRLFEALLRMRVVCIGHQKSILILSASGASSRRTHNARPRSPASTPSGDEAGAVSKLRAAFENIADPQHHLLVKGAADNLQAKRQPVRAEPRRH